MGIFARLFGTKESNEDQAVGDFVDKDIPESYPNGCRQKPFALTTEINKLLGTDTACFVVYDLAALRHRLADFCDWWASPDDEIAELQNRNSLFLGVGADGGYDISVIEGVLAGAPKYSLHFPSGEVFVGAGEGTSGEGMEPDGKYGRGIFLSVEPGDYSITAVLDEAHLRIGICKAQAFSNETLKPVMLCDP